MKNKVGFRVAIKIERYVYDPAVGTHDKLVMDPNVESPHGNWTLNDYCATLAEADAIVAHMVQSTEHSYCCPGAAEEANASNRNRPQGRS